MYQPRSQPHEVFITQLAYPTTAASLCQELFSSRPSFPAFGIIFAALPDSFDIIPSSPLFVKHFLQVFMLFFVDFA